MVVFVMLDNTLLLILRIFIQPINVSSENKLKKRSTWVTTFVFRESAYGECELYGSHIAQVNFTPQFNGIFGRHPKLFY